MTILNARLDEFLKGCKRPDDLLGEAGLMKERKVRLMERMPGAELTAHPGCGACAEPPPGQTNRRNGIATKRVKGPDGGVLLSVPQDRAGSFEPVLVKKGQTRIDGADDRIIGLHAAGLSVRDIQAHLEELYGLRVSPDLISRGEGPSRHRFKRGPERCRAGRGPRMAAPGAGPDVSHCDL